MGKVTDAAMLGGTLTRYSPPIIIGAVGDSLTYGAQANAIPYSHGSKSIIIHAARRANHSFVAGPNDGTGGITAAQLLNGNSPTYPPITGRAPLTDPGVTHVLVLIGTNDTGQGVAVSTTLANIRRCWDYVVAAGKVPIAATIPPRNTSDTAIISAIINLNNGIRRMAAIHGIPCADIFEECIDYTYGSGMAFKTNYAMADGIHLNSVGAYLGAGLAVAKAMSAVVGDATNGYVWRAPRTSPVDSTGSLSSHGLFNTYSGPINVSGSSAAVAGTYWQSTLTMDSGATSTVQDQATGDPNVGAYGNSNIWRLDIPASGFVTVNANYSGGGTQITGVQPGDRIGFTVNFAHRPGGSGPTGNGALNITLRDKNDVGNTLLGYGWSQAAEGIAAMEHIDPSVINAGQIYLERIMPAKLWNGSAPSGNLFLYFNTIANGGIATPASLSLANVGVWNFTQLGVS